MNVKSPQNLNRGECSEQKYLEINKAPYLFNKVDHNKSGFSFAFRKIKPFAFKTIFFFFHGCTSYLKLI